MRILHVVPTYLPAVRYGGPIFAVHGLCRALVSRGHQVEVFTTNVDGDGSSPVPLDVPVNLNGVEVRYFFSNYLRRLSWAPSLAQVLRREINRFDVIHLHTVFLWPMWAAARLARSANVPYLISPRGMLVKGLIERKSNLAKIIWIRLIEKKNLEAASAIHVTSELEKEELVRFNWQLPRIAMIPNGVEDLEYSAFEYPSSDVAKIASNQPLILYFGRINWKKGLDRLLEAFALTSVGQLAIVGPDEESLVPQLQILAKKLGICRRTHFLPRTVLASDKAFLFSKARLFVLSSYSENFGNTVIEAMQRGISVVVTPEVGAAEIVQGAAGGLVVQGDPQSLSKGINRLIQQPVLAEKLGANGRRYVSANLAWSKIAGEMEGLYELVRRPLAESSGD
jgi:glycosyltransferase involved in cell wall biosynthesis